MTDRYYTDIKLTDAGQFAAGAGGDLLLVSDLDCLMQDIRQEAVTAEGDLFYDADYGWSLLDFIHRPYDDLIALELEQRIIGKLAERDEIDVTSIIVTLVFADDMIDISIGFAFVDIAARQQFTVQINKLKIEVIPID